MLILSLGTLLIDKAQGRISAGITVIGKGAYIPDGAQIGRNVLINSERDETAFPADGIVADGATI